MAMLGPSQPLTIDLRFLDRPGVVAAFLLRGEGEAALVDLGPASTVETLLAAVTEAGTPLEEVRHLLVTHVHLDHAGAAGVLLQRLPWARLYVHELGAPHLIDPTKLIASATRIYGSLMKKLWGTILPVPADRLVVLGDGQRLYLAGHRIDVLYTPGHALHHVSFRDLDSGEIFTGDVAGVRLPGCSFVRPPTPPPDLDLDAWDASLDRLAGLQAPAFYVAHFGRCVDTPAHLAELRTHLRDWEQVVLAGMRAGQDRTTIAATMQRLGDEELIRRQADEEVRSRYEMASAYAMNVAGYERYLRKRYPDLAPPAIQAP